MRQIGVYCPECNSGYGIYDTEYRDGWECRCGYLLKDEHGSVDKWVNNLKIAHSALTQLISDIEEDHHFHRCKEKNAEHDALSDARYIIKETLRGYEK